MHCGHAGMNNLYLALFPPQPRLHPTWEHRRLSNICTTSGLLLENHSKVLSSIDVWPKPSLASAGFEHSAQPFCLAGEQRRVCIWLDSLLSDSTTQGIAAPKVEPHDLEKALAAVKSNILTWSDVRELAGVPRAGVKGGDATLADGYGVKHILKPCFFWNCFASTGRGRSCVY